MNQPSAVPDTGRSERPGLLPPRTLAGFAVAILAVLLIAIFSYHSLRTRSTTADRVTHTLEVITQLELLLSSIKDAETGQRGFLLTDEERYLEPYMRGKAELVGRVKSLRDLTGDSPEQQRRLDSLEQLIAEKAGEMQQTISLRRGGDAAGALALVRTDRGRAAMDRIRVLVGEMESEERALFARREGEWQDAAGSAFLITTGSVALLLLLIGAAAFMASRDYRARETQTWLRAGQMCLGARMEGEQRLDRLGENVLESLAVYLDAQVGAIHLTEPGGRFRRIAGYALPPGPDDEARPPGDGLLGQAAKENRVIHVRDVPEGYLPVRSSVGRGKPRELLVTPASVDGVVHAVVELGFFRRVDSVDQELFTRVSESMAVAVRASKDRTRLEELLEETQRQGETLQTQQEELRVNNEELEEQGRVLKESQARLEEQQAELQQINAQLEEQTRILEEQKDELSTAEVILTERAAELARSNQYKTEFLANMSHELRTPLNSSLILAKLLAENKDGNLTEEQVKFASTIFSAGNDLLALINDILDLSKIEAGKVEVQPEPVVIARMVDGIAGAFEPLAQERALEFRAAVEPGTPERIETDPQRLGQILRNLLSNALKFTEAGEISLRVSAESGGRVSFAVRDTGIGIPAEQHDAIFEAFRQADGSTHRKYGGTGLGLSISRDLARLLGGEIAVESARGQGSLFTLTLPLVHARPVEVATARASEATARVEAPPRRAGQPTRTHAATPGAPRPTPEALEDDRGQLIPDSRLILVVEDDAGFAAILRDLAHEMGFQCVVEVSASEGLAAASAYRPTAILLDVNLPDHSGLGVLEQLKRNPHTRHIPVHIVSATDHTRDALDLGAVGYALKPVKREQLIDAFQRLEGVFSQGLRRVLVVEDDERQRESIRLLLGDDDVDIIGVETASEALARLRETTFDCMVMDLNLPDLSGHELLERMAAQEHVSFPPVIVYTGRSLTGDEEQTLRRFSRSIIIKGVRSPERLLDEVSLFLHRVESKLPLDRQRMLRAARDRDEVLEGRRILVVEDDVRNVFALSSLLEPRGAKVEIARNGREALEVLSRSLAQASRAVDLVLMDIMMPEMDGLTAMREIRKRPEWRKLPIIALTAKAMKDDHERCLAAGASDYITKPLDVERLLSLVRVWMPRS